MSRKVTRSWDFYDLGSIGLLFLIILFYSIRFPYLPQYIDAYYHLCCANGFIKAGGWVGYSFWDYAPWGRPQLYPPLYHFVLVFLKKIGLDGLNAIRFTEIIFPSLFFFIFWKSLRIFNSSTFSMFSLLSLSSFFPFFSLTSAQIPATLALIFGFLSWYFFFKEKIISTSVCLILSFYSHAAIPWMFFLSYVFMGCDRKYRFRIFKILVSSLIGVFPLFLHQMKYIKFLRIELLKEYRFIHLSPFILGVGTLSLFFYKYNKKDIRWMMFFGFLLASAFVFSKYPYRLLSAQGFIGFVLLSSLFFEKVSWFNRKFIFFFLCVFLLMMHTTLDFEGSKVKITYFNSTYYNYVTGGVFKLLEFNSLFYPKYYLPILDVIFKEIEEDEIISSNNKVISQIFSSLSFRATSNSMLYEVKGKKENPYDFAKLVIWVKSDGDYSPFLKKYGWKKIYENEIAYVFKNEKLNFHIVPKRACVSFFVIGWIFLAIIATLIWDNLKKA